jgi:hypothetical protein
LHSVAERLLLLPSPLNTVLLPFARSFVSLIFVFNLSPLLDPALTRFSFFLSHSFCCFYCALGPNFQN